MDEKQAFKLWQEGDAHHLITSKLSYLEPRGPVPNVAGVAASFAVSFVGCLPLSDIASRSSLNPAGLVFGQV